MLNKEIILTPQGMEKIEKELDFLKSVKRKEIASRIKEAISFGDISENSEYEDAKNEQAFVEGRIATLEKWLAECDTVKKKRMVTAGSAWAIPSNWSTLKIMRNLSIL